MDVFLNNEPLNEFSDFIQKKSNYLVENDFYKNHYNLLCVSRDRLRNCVEYLNKNSQQPKTEEEFIFFLTISCMIVDATKKLTEKLKIKHLYSEENSDKPEMKQYFKDCFLEFFHKKTENDCPTDDKFFEYFRALAFAHPYETSRPKFLEQNEVHYSPFVIKEDCTDNRGLCGVFVYSNCLAGAKSLLFPFETLKQYIASRYAVLSEITAHLKNAYKKQENDWKKRKVNRTLSNIEILQDIQSILTERHKEDMMEDLISHLSCKLSNENNSLSVARFREIIIEKLPLLCDAIDNMDYKKCYDIVNIFCIEPRTTYNGFGYQIEKIFTRSDLSWAKREAEIFSQKFAKNWVTIDTNTMSYAEIKLLVRTACYLEWEHQGENK